MSAVTVEAVRTGVRFKVRVQPRASRSEVAGTHDGALKIRLHAPPVDGAANDALVLLLADWLGVLRRDVRIVVGETSRSKVVEVHGVAPEQVERLVTPLTTRR